MFLIMLFSKIAQTASVRWTKWPAEVKIEFSKIFLNDISSWTTG